MRLKWTELALNDFVHQHDYILTDNPQAARKVAQRIWDAAQRLVDYPHIGRVGEDEDTREWPVQHTACVIVYRIHGDAIEILRIWHSKQNWRGPTE